MTDVKSDEELVAMAEEYLKNLSAQETQIFLGAKMCMCTGYAQWYQCLRMKLPNIDEQLVLGLALIYNKR